MFSVTLKNTRYIVRKPQLIEILVTQFKSVPAFVPLCVPEGISVTSGLHGRDRRDAARQSEGEKGEGESSTDDQPGSFRNVYRR